MGKLVSYNSRFDKRVLVVFLSEDHERYAEFAPLFKAHGLAFLHEKKYIFMDYTTIKKQGYGKDHIVFIESHEIAHLKMGHNDQMRPKFEAEADFVGILMCQKKNLGKSAKIGTSYFKKRNKISFKDYAEDHLEKLKKNKRISNLIQ
jgi:hypothetical protein